MTRVRAWLALLMFYLLAGTAIAADADPYRGMVYLNPAPGCASHAGGLVGRDEAGDELWLARVECDDREMIWVETSFYEQGIVLLWRVEDVLVLPLLDADEDVVNGMGPLVYCEYHGQPVREILAIGTLVFRGDVGDLTLITGAWIVNAGAKRIEAISPDDVTCRNYLVN
jgi:hypothetical protein